MVDYHFHLENSNGLTGDADVRAFATDEAALAEAKRAAGEVLMDELVTGEPKPIATVTLERGGHRVAVVCAHASFEEYATRGHG